MVRRAGPCGSLLLLRWPRIRSDSRDDRRGDVAPSATHGHARAFDPDLELVHLAVEDRWREAEHVLAVQLLRDTGERRAQLVFLRHLEEPAAGFFREPLEPPVGPRPLPRLADYDLALHPDRIHHDVLL